MSLLKKPYVMRVALVAFAATKGYAVEISSFTVSDLLSGHRSTKLAEVLQTSGILAVSIDSSPHREAALSGLCRCRDNLVDLDGAESLVLGDTVTERTTLATATAGTTPLPLPSQLSDRCGADTFSAMEGLRDEVARVSDVFVFALDRLLGGGGVLLRNKLGGQYNSVASIRNGANNLEHFHVYTKGSIISLEEEQESLEWHTDAGLFLAFVPAKDCISSIPDSSFLLRDGPVTYPEHSVVIMLGAGAQFWLDTPFPLMATRHAVKMNNGDMRAWYGMMHLVPESAIIQENPAMTFASMKQSIVLSSEASSSSQAQNDISVGCGHSTIHHDMDMNTDRFVIPRRRLGMVSDANACNNVTNFYCWMSCLDIPNSSQAQSEMSAGNSLYCLDPSTLAQSGGQVSEAVKPCQGNVHNAACMGSWQPTASGVEATQVQLEAPTKTESPFCYGGTSMYMDGFHWLDSTCVIYLFPNWILSSAGKLAGACVLTIILAALLELVIYQRRTLLGSMRPGYTQLAASGLCYGVQLFTGYFLMLVVMTYSGPLFMCVIVGLVIGHVLFNARGALLVKPPCPVSVSDKNEADDLFDSEAGTQSSKDDNPANSTYCGATQQDVPEGITPCCQNAL